MKRNTLILLFVLAVVLLCGIILAFVLTKRAPATVPSTPVTFPSATTTNGQTSTQTQTMTVAARGTGSPITVKDFTKDGVTIVDPSNQGRYYLTGIGPSEFSISYDTSKQFFTISLDQEPIGKARTDAERYLLNALNISKDQLCSINYYLSTTNFVNEAYSGKNLGFSFCPGATLLP